MRSLLLIFVMGFALISCESNIEASGTRAISGSWDMDEVISFDIPKLDSIKRYHMFLNVRNSNDFPYNNLFLIVSMKFPHGKTITDTLEYRMAHPDGQWMGEGFGGIKENKLWYKENITFPEEGTYVLSISQAVRNNGEAEGVSQLEGITDVGYSIEEASQQ